MNYGYTKELSAPFQEAVEDTKNALAAEGFGILTEINVQETLKQKLDVEFDHYMILGACKPSLAHKALLAEREIGLLLPCNVIVYEHESVVYVSTILPTIAMQVVENEALQDIATEVEAQLKVAIDSIA